MNAGRAPQRIGEAHLPDQLTNVRRDLWSAAAGAGFPAPELTESGAMPSDDGLGLDDFESIGNPWRNAKKSHGDQSIKTAES